MLSRDLTLRIYHIDKNVLSSKNFFILKNTFKIALEYLFNVFILLNTVYYLKLNFKLNIDTKICTFKNLEEIWKKQVATLVFS